MQTCRQMSKKHAGVARHHAALLSEKTAHPRFAPTVLDCIHAKHSPAQWHGGSLNTAANSNPAAMLTSCQLPAPRMCGHPSNNCHPKKLPFAAPHRTLSHVAWLACKPKRAMCRKIWRWGGQAREKAAFCMPVLVFESTCAHGDRRTLMTYGILRNAPDAVYAAAFSRRRLSKRTQSAGVAAQAAARTAAQRAPALAAVASSGGIPALRPRPVPSPQESIGDDSVQPSRPRAPPLDRQKRGSAEGSSSDPRRRQQESDASSKGIRRQQVPPGGAVRLTELPAGKADPDPGRGPARRPLDVGSPRRREAMLARALLRLPAGGADYGAVLSGQQLSGPEITRSALCK